MSGSKEVVLCFIADLRRDRGSPETHEERICLKYVFMAVAAKA